MDYSKMSTEKLLQLRLNVKEKISKFDNLQQNKKVCL